VAATTSIPGFSLTITDPKFEVAMDQAKFDLIGPMMADQAMDFAADAYQIRPEIIARAKKITGE
jgi:hypothetical protein